MGEEGGLSRIKCILLFSLVNSSLVFLVNTEHNVLIFNLIFQYVKVYDHINIFLSSSPCVTEVTKNKGPDLLHSFVNQGNSVQVSGIKVA